MVLSPEKHAILGAWRNSFRNLGNGKTMKKLNLLLIALFTLTLSLSGCGGGSSEATSTVSDADQAAIDDYEALLEEEENSMNDAPPADELEE